MTRCRCSSCFASDFDQKTFVAGFSFGATFAAQAAARRPELVAALIATAMDIDVPSAEKHTYDFVLSTARRQGNRRAIRQLEKSAPPHVEAEQFITRARSAELRRCDRQRHLLHPHARVARQPARSPDTRCRRHPHAARRPHLTGRTATPTRHDRPGAHRPALTCRSSSHRDGSIRSHRPKPPTIIRLTHGAKQTVRLVRELSPHAAIRRAAKFRDTLMTVRATQPPDLAPDPTAPHLALRRGAVARSQLRQVRRSSKGTFFDEGILLYELALTAGIRRRDVCLASRGGALSG